MWFIACLWAREVIFGSVIDEFSKLLYCHLMIYYFLQDDGKAGNHYVVYSASDDGYPSPISCLEASFSDTLKPNCGSGVENVRKF